MGKRSQQRKRGERPKRSPRRRRAPRQLGLAARGTGRGGYRAGAGRPRIPEPKRTFVAHRRRPSLPNKTPVHVTLRLVEGMPSLRRIRTVRWIRRCIQLGHKDRFRVVQFSVMKNHLHLIVEAQDRRALSRGMQGLTVRFTKRLNRLFGRKGTMFRERYHARQLRTPREVRWGLNYVLGNARRHAWQGHRKLARDWVDPFSSAPEFTDWTVQPWTDACELGEVATRPAQFWLLTTGWQRSGPLDPNAIPGPAG
jgi:REP element-mobilizing transposase RayT